MPLSAVDELADLEASREKRKAALAEARAAQKLEDLKAIDALELELGDSNVCIVELPYTPGLPVLIAARCPSSTEVKRFQDRLRKGKDGDDPDPLAATREVGAACRKYPDAETWAKVLEARPGALLQLGNEAMKLAAGRIRDAGKG